jgi:hypothetical protein
MLVNKPYGLTPPSRLPPVPRRIQMTKMTLDPTTLTIDQIDAFRKYTPEQLEAIFGGSSSTSKRVRFNEMKAKLHKHGWNVSASSSYGWFDCEKYYETVFTKERNEIFIEYSDVNFVIYPIFKNDDIKIKSVMSGSSTFGIMMVNAFKEKNKMFYDIFGDNGLITHTSFDNIYYVEFDKFRYVLQKENFEAK